MTMTMKAEMRQPRVHEMKVCCHVMPDDRRDAAAFQPVIPNDIVNQKVPREYLRHFDLVFCDPTDRHSRDFLRMNPPFPSSLFHRRWFEITIGPAALAHCCLALGSIWNSDEV